MAYDESKDLAKRTQSDEALRGKAFKIASDPKYDAYQRGLATMAYKFFDKKSSGSAVDTEPNYQIANELHKQIIRQFKRRKIYLKFYCSDYYYVTVNKYCVKCGTSLRLWEIKGWINKIDPYGWFQWYFRYWLGRRSKDDKRQINRWKKL